MSRWMSVGAAKTVTAQAHCPLDVVPNMTWKVNSQATTWRQNSGAAQPKMVSSDLPVPEGPHAMVNTSVCVDRGDPISLRLSSAGPSLVFPLQLGQQQDKACTKT